MKKRNKNKRYDFIANKLNKYSIRKFTVGTTSILIGSLLFLGNPADAQAEETTQSVTTTEKSTAPPTTEAPTTEAPTTEAPTTEALTTEAPTTEVPTTEAPTTEVPTTEAPTTEAPTTEAPTTEAPTTEAPTTEAPTTEAPTTEAPTTENETPVSELTVKEAVTNVEQAPTIQEREALLTTYIAEATGTTAEAAKTNLDSLNLDYANLTDQEVLAALLAAVANEQNANTVVATPVNTTTNNTMMNSVSFASNSNLLDGVLLKNLDADGTVNSLVTASNLTFGNTTFDPNNSGYTDFSADLKIDDAVVAGNTFTIQVPNQLTADGDIDYAWNNNVMPVSDIKSPTGEVIATGTYDLVTKKIVYTFTDYVDTHNNVTANWSIPLFTDRDQVPNVTTLPVTMNVAGETTTSNITFDYASPYQGQTGTSGANVTSLITDATLDESGKGTYQQTIYVNPLEKPLYNTTVTLQGDWGDPALSSTLIGMDVTKLKILAVNDATQLNDSYYVNPTSSNFVDVTTNYYNSGSIFMNSDGTLTVNFGNDTEYKSFVILVDGQHDITEGQPVLTRVIERNTDYYNANPSEYYWDNNFITAEGQAIGEGDLSLSESISDSISNSLSESVNDSISDSLSDSVNDSISDSLSDSVNDSISDSLSDSVNDSISDSLSDSVNDSISDSLSDSVNDSISDSLSDSVNDSISDSLSDSVNDSISDSLSDSVNDSISDSLSDSVNDSISDSLSDSANDSISDSLSDSVNDSISDSLSDSANDSISDSLSDSVNDSISDSLSDSVNDSISDSLSDSLNDSISDSLSDSANDSISDSLSDSVNDSISDSLSDSVNDSISDSLSDSVNDSISDSVSDSSSDSISDSVSDSSSDSISDSVSDSSSDSISDSVSDSSSDSISDSVSDSSSDSISDSVSDSSSDSISDSVSDSSSDSISDSVSDSSSDSISDSVSDSSSDSISDSVSDSSSDSVSDSVSDSSSDSISDSVSDSSSDSISDSVSDSSSDSISDSVSDSSSDSISDSVSDSSSDSISDSMSDSSSDSISDSVSDSSSDSISDSVSDSSSDSISDSVSDSSSDSISDSVSDSSSDSISDSTTPSEVLYDLGDKVWYDADKDGIQGANEPGIEGVTVTLTKPDGTTVTTTTDANGNYIFTDLPNGDYVVTFETPDGYNGPTVVNAGDDALDSDGQVVNVTIQDADDMTIDSGFIKVKVGDTVWEDTNKDGVQDEGEPGIPGVEVTITYPDGTTETVVTDENGYYEFPNVPNGESTIEFKTPDGYIPTTENVGDDTKDSDGTKVTVNVDGKDDPTIDSGFIKETPVYDLGDKVWFDEDKDGIQDANESGIEGVTVTLTKPDGTTVTTTTDANGNYIFEDLPNGDYVVTFETPDGYNGPTVINTGDDALDSDGQVVNVTIQDADDMTIDSGFIKVKVGDTVWEDTNKDGVQDEGEPGIPGVEVTITYPDGTTETVVTDENGYYEFPNVPNGESTIEFKTPDGYIPTTENVGDDTKDSDGTKVTVNVDGKDDPTIDSGFIKETPVYDLGDKVWFDEDKDGIQDAYESGIEGVTVTLTKPDGTTVTTTTDANGNYIFTDLPNGDYVVTFETPDGYNGPTVVNAGDDALDSDGQVVNVTIQDADDMTIDSGFIKVKVGDTVWEDTNKDGVQDEGEPGIPGVEVTITYPDGTTETVVTDENGYYEFPNVPNGESTIEFKTPDGYIPTTENVGDDTKDSDGTKVTVNVDGKDDPTIDSGFIKETPVYDLGDKVWFDEDKDGIQDANESGIEGVTVTLTKPDGTTVTTTTDANGNYIFTDLPNGDYVVTFETPVGMDPTKVNVGDDALDSDGTSVKVTIKDADNMTIDSGFVKTQVVPTPKPQGNLELGDKVWFDEDKDGIQDANESGIEGVKVTLTKPDGTTVTTTTDANGNYIFTGLEPGDYVVTFETPAGMDPTKLNVGGDALDSDGTSVKVHLTENDYTIDSGFVVKEVPTEPGEDTPTPDKGVPAPGKDTPTPDKGVPAPGKDTPTPDKGVPAPGKEVKELPDTGESNNNGLLATAFAGLGGLLLFRKRREENQENEMK
nr:SdrD B-like domain-containing protein [Macrococcus armenti]